MGIPQPNPSRERVIISAGCYTSQTSKIQNKNPHGRTTQPMSSSFFSLLESKSRPSKSPFDLYFSSWTDYENEKRIGENNNYKPFYIISSEKCRSLNIPGTDRHAERKRTPQGWVGPALSLHNSEISRDLKRPMLNDPEVLLRGKKNPKCLYGDTITNVNHHCL